MAKEDMKIREEKAYKKAEIHFFKPFLKCEKNSEPHLYFVFSSPGAGKSTNIKSLIKDKLGTNQPIIFEIDELKSFIPEDSNLIDVTNKWFLRLTDKAISEKRSLVIMRLRNMLKPMQTLDIYNKAKSAGYTTHASFVALDKVRSRLGMIHRYEYALDDNNLDEQHKIESYPRKPDFTKHYIFYKILPVVLACCCHSKAVDVIEVFDREKNKLAWWNKKSGEKSEISPLRALFNERHRKWEDWEKNKFNNRCMQAKIKLEEHNRSFIDMIKFKLLTKTHKNR